MVDYEGMPGRESVGTGEVWETEGGHGGLSINI